MADEYSSQQIADYIQGIQAQGGGNAEIAAAMDQFGVTPAQVSAATGVDTGTVQSLYNAAAPSGAYYSAPSSSTSASTPASTSTGNVGIATIPVTTAATNAGVASIPIAQTDALNTFAQTYAANPNLSNVQIGQLIADLHLTPAQAAKITGVDEKTARENYLSGQELIANNPNLAIAYNAVQQGGQVQITGYDDNNNPIYALNNQIVTPNKDGTFSFQSGNNSRGGTDTYTFSVDAQGNAVAPKDPLAAYKWTPGSSSNFADLTKSTIQNLGPIGQIGLAIATGGMSIPEQLAANFAYSVAGGADPKKAALNLAASYAGGQALGLQDIKDITSSLDKIDPSGVSSQAFKGAVVGVTKGALTGQDIVDTALAGAKSGGIYGATAAITDNIPELDGLTANQRKAVNNVVSGMLSGKPLDQLAINAAISVAKETAKDVANNAKPSDVIDSLKKIGLSESEATNALALINNANDGRTGLDIVDLTQNNIKLAGQGLMEDPGGFKPNVITKTADGYFSTVTMPDGTLVHVPVVFDQNTGAAKIDPLSKYANDTNALKQINLLKVNDVSQIDPRYLDKTPINPNLSSAELSALSKVTGKPSSFQDFLSSINLKGTLGADLSEIGDALTIPEIADIASKAQNTGYVNDIADYFKNSTKPSDQQFYQDLMKEVVTKNPSLSNNKTVQDILNTDVQHVTTPAVHPEEIVVTTTKLNDQTMFVDEYGNQLTKDQVDEITRQTGIPPKVTPITNVVANPLKPVNPIEDNKPTDNKLPGDNNPPPVAPDNWKPNIPVITPDKTADKNVDNWTPNIPVITPDKNIITSADNWKPTLTTITPDKNVITPPSTQVTPVVSTPTSKTPTTVSPSTGFSMPQAQSIAAAFGLPQLANVFYYGKDFSSKKEKVNKKGELEEEEYKPLSVTAPGEQGELVEEAKNKENNANDALDLILGKSGNQMSLDDILNIVKGA
jgi:hypothetical protein